MKFKKQIFATLLILTMTLVCFPSMAASYSPAKAALESKIASRQLFKAEIVEKALLTNDSKIISEVTKEASMNISIPNIDVTKIAPSYSPTLISLPNFQHFLDELTLRDVNPSLIKTMTYAEYCALEETWQLSNESIRLTKKLYPELKDVDLSSWTYKDSNDYMNSMSFRSLKDRFSEEQLTELKERDIIISDTFYLFKEFHTAENILNQTDQTIKNTLERCYYVNLEMIFGANSTESIAASTGNTLLSSTPTRANPPSNLYTYINFPHYGYDYFRNTILTTAANRERQADAAILIKGCLYAISVDATSPSTQLNCSNMYGTYSYSSNGAHEGIDFVYGTTRLLHSPVEGTNLYASTYHQLSIYDASHDGSPKTFSFLHLSSRESASSFSYGETIGRQGNEGFSDGYHTHFQVHSGRTTVLASAKGDHNVDSLEPYFCMDYYLGW